MKTMKLWMMAAILFCGVGCVSSNSGSSSDAKDDQDSVDLVEEMGNYVFMPAVDQYLVDSIGAFYAPGELCIPCATIVACDQYSCDQSTPDSVFMWGDFWVFNYKVAGDTLKTVSGGNHSGKMLLKKNETGEFQVLSFEQVEDGAGNLESAKRIFGEYYDAYHAANSDEAYREKARAGFIADYVKAHNLPVKFYQDFGWPAKEIPVEE